MPEELESPLATTEVDLVEETQGPSYKVHAEYELYSLNNNGGYVGDCRGE